MYTGNQFPFKKYSFLVQNSIGLLKITHKHVGVFVWMYVCNSSKLSPVISISV